MPLRQFKADLAAASKRVAQDPSTGVISAVKGDEDGEVVLTYVHQSLEDPLRVRMLCQDVDQYPDQNSFFIFTDSENPPQVLVAAMNNLKDFSAGSRIAEMIFAITATFTETLKPSAAAASSRSGPADDQDAEMTDAGEPEGQDDDDEDNAEDDGYDDYDDEDDADVDFDSDEYDDDLFPSPTTAQAGARAPQLTPTAAAALSQRIKEDLRKAKAAGFRVGIIKGMDPSDTTHIVSIAIRARRLGLADDALAVWGDIQGSDYIVLLYQVDGRYKTFEEVLKLPVDRTSFSFFIGKCSSYKPDLVDATGALQTTAKSIYSSEKPQLSHPSGRPKFGSIAVSKSLKEFLTERFVTLVKLRHFQKLSWDDANLLLLDQFGRVDHDEVADASAHTTETGGRAGDPISASWGDELVDAPEGLKSLPLAAMQLAMRHLVFCTKYCLVCHRLVDEDFDSLKPYVCSSPLCLYQYISLGFGPSLEHELVVRPTVVDLLVSFCYSAAAYGLANSCCPIRDFPVGLRMRVPDLSFEGTGQTIEGCLSEDGTEFVLYDSTKQKEAANLGEGQWVAMCWVDGTAETAGGPFPGRFVRHARVQSFHPATKTLVLRPMSRTQSDDHLGRAPPVPEPTAARRRARLTPYSLDFDSMDSPRKLQAMCHILDTLPGVNDLKATLECQQHLSLQSVENVSPAARSLLEWIVASNRSYIVPMDPPTVPADGTLSGEQAAYIEGMEDHVQFLFAQGSPEKEKRFKQALASVQARLQLKHPTLLAWHGSRLPNWHSIVRMGLDFSNVQNGRAFGDGVYFSSAYRTSSQYSQFVRGLPGLATKRSWAGSNLRVDAAIGLNEIINAPEEFVSWTPHYVVKQPDWHQCRFLFVKSSPPPQLNPADGVQPVPAQTATSMATATTAMLRRRVYYQQDPGHRVMGPRDKYLDIPLAALSPQGTPSSKAAWAVGRGDVGTSSDVEDEVDAAFFLSDDRTDNETAMSRSVSLDSTAARRATTKRPMTPPHIDHKVTQFKPGTLDLSTLTRLNPPSWAAGPAVRGLSFEVHKLQELQAKTPTHELGWYMDFLSMDNIFQWIVELHSFDLALPLGADMAAMDIPSIVLELRFGAEYPISPPFVRVVRPRFLPFAQGGGGHVTAGGAMCMELLTNSGWSPAISLESVLLQVRLALCSLDPRPARLQRGPGGKVVRPKMPDYGIGEAIEAYIRAATTHGWKIPVDLRRMAQF